MSKVIKRRSVSSAKTSKVSRKDIAQIIDETIEWMIVKFGIPKSSKKIKRLTKSFTRELADELKYLVKKARKKKIKEKIST